MAERFEKKGTGGSRLKLYLQGKSNPLAVQNDVHLMQIISKDRFGLQQIFQRPVTIPRLRRPTFSKVSEGPALRYSKTL